MGTVNPTTQAANPTYYTGRQYKSVRHDAPGSTPAGGKLIKLSRLKLMSAGGTAVADNEFWSVRGLIACAWQPSTINDAVGVRVTSDGAAASTAAPAAGVIYALVSGSQQGTSTSMVLDAGRFTEQVTQNEKAAAPDTFSNGPGNIRTANLNMQVIPFQLLGASDQWKCTTGTRGSDTLCPGIVAVAWQSQNPSVVTQDRVVVTLDAGGDVVFTGGQAGTLGWLWVWRTVT